MLPNGLVLIAGGYNDISQIASAELYNPATGTWTTTGSLATARENHTATLLPNGLVVVTGGIGSVGYLAGVELYNPAAGTWTTTGSLSNARYNHTATLLPNGLVLVTGGKGYNGYLASTELYYSGFGFSPAIPTLAVGSTITAQTLNGLFTLNFTNITGMPFIILTSTNASLPLTSWSMLGVPTELFPGYFQFTDPQIPTAARQFYRFVSP